MQLQHDGLTVVAEGGLPGEALEQDTTQRVEVGAVIQPLEGCGLFGTHVRRGAHGKTGAGELLAASDLDCPGDAEVEQHRPAIRNDDVLGFHIPVDDAPVVGIAERIEHISCELRRFLKLDLTDSIQVASERRTFLIVHDEVDHPVGFAIIDEAGDSWMVETREDLDLAQEPIGGDADLELRMEHLQGDGLVVGIAGQENPARTPTGNLPIDGVPIFQCCLDQR